MNTFWMVIGPQGNARVRHETFRAAESEAMRLATLEAGKAFYVVRTLGFYQVTTPEPLWRSMA